MGRAPFWPNNVADGKELGDTEVQESPFDPEAPEKYSFNCRTEPLFAALNPKHDGPTSIVWQVDFGSSAVGTVTTAVLSTKDLATAQTLPIPGQIILSEDDPVNEETLAYYGVTVDGSTIVFNVYTDVTNTHTGDTITHASFSGVTDDMIATGGLSVDKIEGKGLELTRLTPFETQTIESDILYNSRQVFSGFLQVNHRIDNTAFGGTMSCTNATILVLNNNSGTAPATTTGSITLTDITGGVNGQMIYLFTNNGLYPAPTNKIIIMHNGATATTGFRLKNGTGSSDPHDLSNFYGCCFINIQGVWFERAFLS